MDQRKLALSFRAAYAVAALVLGSASVAAEKDKEREASSFADQTVNSRRADIVSGSASKRSPVSISHGSDSWNKTLKEFAEGIKALRSAVGSQNNRLATQEQRLQAQMRVNVEQEKIIEEQRKQIDFLRAQFSKRSAPPVHRLVQPRPGMQGVVSNRPLVVRPTHRESPKPASEVRRQAPAAEQTQQAAPRPPEVAAIPELGGVLTPKGRLVLEPAIQYSNSSLNRFTFSGIEIIEAFLIGLIRAEDADRDLISPQITARYGVTNRLELEAKVPYVYRSDNLSVTIPTLPRDPQSGEPPEIARGLNGDGLGDIELALHYQINRGLNGWPFFVGNVRWKSDTGEGPFDVDRDAFGVETELPTGSGFHSLEPSVTVLYPSDPAVFFANIGYLLNMEDDIDMTFVTQIDAPSGEETQTIGTVDPGDVFRFSFGMGYALNERSSFTLGYKHDFINETDTEINSVTVPSASLDVGSLLVGWGYSITNRFATNLNLELGITDDAPDVLMTLRVPILAHQF